MKLLKYILCAALFSVSAHADFAQIQCLSAADRDQSYYTFSLDVNTHHTPLWPDRVNLVHVRQNDRKQLFSAVDVFDDYLHNPSVSGEHRFVAKNYNDVKYRNLQVAFVLNTTADFASRNTPFILSLDFSGRFGTIFEGLQLECIWSPVNTRNLL